MQLRIFKSNENEFTLTVQDTGIGISKEDQKGDTITHEQKQFRLSPLPVIFNSPETGFDYGAMLGVAKEKPKKK